MFPLLNGLAEGASTLNESIEAAQEVEPVGATPLGDELARIETYLRRNGLGELCERPDAERDAAARAAAGRTAMLMLVAAFVVFVLAVDFDSVGVGVAVPLISLLLGAALVLRVRQRVRRGQRPIARAGISIVFLVLLVTYLGLAFNFSGVGSWGEGVAIGAATFVVLAGARYVFATSVASLVWNAIQALQRGLATSILATARGMPLVFVVLIAIFFTSDAWRFLTDVSTWRFFLCAALVASIVLAMTLATMRSEALKLAELAFVEPLSDLAAATPAERLARSDAPTAKRLTRRSAQRNVEVSVYSVVLARIAAVGATTGLVFVLIGTLLADHTVQQDLVGRAPHAVVMISGLVVSTELLRVAFFLALLASAAFAAIVLSDDGYRALFVDDQIQRLRKVLAAWAYYAAAVDDVDAPTSNVDSRTPVLDSEEAAERR